MERDGLRAGVQKLFAMDITPHPELPAAAAPVPVYK
jgi:hypothetical protein